MRCSKLLTLNVFDMLFFASSISTDCLLDLQLALVICLGIRNPVRERLIKLLVQSRFFFNHDGYVHNWYYNHVVARSELCW